MNVGNAWNRARMLSSRRAVVLSSWFELSIHCASWSPRSVSASNTTGVLDPSRTARSWELRIFTTVFGRLLGEGRQHPEELGEPGALALDALAEVLLPYLERLARRFVECAQDLVELDRRRDLRGHEAPALGMSDAVVEPGVSSM